MEDGEDVEGGGVVMVDAERGSRGDWRVDVGDWTLGMDGGHGRGSEGDWRVGVGDWTLEMDGGRSITLNSGQSQAAVPPASCGEKRKDVCEQDEVDHLRMMTLC